MDFDDQMSRMIVKEEESLMILSNLHLVAWTRLGMMPFLILSIPGNWYPGIPDCKFESLLVELVKRKKKIISRAVHVGHRLHSIYVVHVILHIDYIHVSIFETFSDAKC